tara:strand:+ start:1639 stop:2070 length:432 start_codon:yes stop_codon:yes gene_type:complete
MFDYCVWLVLDKKCYTTINSDFPFHISLQTGIKSKDDALKNASIFRNLCKLPIKLTFDEELIQTHSDGFTALQVTINIPSRLENILPDDAHVSILYAYDIVFNETEIESLKSIVEKLDPLLIFNHIALYNCDGHFTKWKEIIN